MPHLCKPERKCPTPLRRRLSRIRLFLAGFTRRAGADIEDESTKSRSALQLLRIPSVIDPDRRASAIAVRWTDDLLCSGYKCVFWFEMPWFLLGGQVIAEWSRCPGSMPRRVRDSVVAPLRRSSADWMPARIWRLFTGVGRRHPVTVCKASLMAGSKGRVWALWYSAGEQFSTVE